MKHRRQFALNVINKITYDWQLNTLVKWHLQIQSHMFDPHICFFFIALILKNYISIVLTDGKNQKSLSWFPNLHVHCLVNYIATSRSEEVPEMLLRDGICSSQGSDSITSKQETLQVQPKKHLHRVRFAFRYRSASSHDSEIHFAAPL